MGITEEFHQKALFGCLDELIHSSQLTHESISGANTIHEHTFAVLKRCEKCNKFLREIQHQQFLCQGVYKQYATSVLSLLINCLELY
jgi:protein-arginine kinase activator protein McsA